MSERSPQVPRPLQDWSLGAQYAVSLGIMTATLILGWIVREPVGRAPFLPVLAPLLPLVVLVRPGPFLAAALLGLLGSAILFLPPFGDVAPPGMIDVVLLGLIALALVAATLASFFSARVQDARKRSEAELRWRSSQLETLFERAPLGMYLVDSRLRIRQVNPVARSWFGAEPAGVLGHDFTEIADRLWSEEYAARVVRIFRRTLETGEPQGEAEEPAWRVDREALEHYQWRVDRIILPDGSHGAVCYFREVSEQVEARRAVGASEERYRTLLESIDEGFAVIEMLFDDDGEARDYRFVEVNPAFEKHTGLRDAEGRRASELVPDLEEHWFRAYGRVARTGEPERFVEFAEPMGGRWFDVYALRVGGDESRRVALLFTDITERKRTDDALRESEERLRVAKAAGGLGIHDFHVQENRVEWDARTRELWGVAPDEPITYEKWRDSVDPEDRTEAEAAVRRALDPAGDGSYFAEYRVANRKDGKVRWVQTTGHATFVDGRAVRLVGTVQDVTERRRVEEALRDADRRKDEFLAILAHELRNPLGPIRTAAKLLPSLQDDGERFGEVSAVIERQVSTIARLIDDLLDVGRITRGKIELHEERIDLNTLLDEAASLVRPTCEEEGMDLRLRLPDGPLLFRGDRVRMAQVLNNLLLNACKYTPQGGRIELGAERDGGEAVVVVRDTGAGIAREDLERVFEMFTQVTSERGRTGGLGIGLPLARSLVELHGGTITAESDGRGKGSTFTVRLPLTMVDEEVAVSRDGDERPDAQGRPSRRVLLVDDHEDALLPMQMLLEFRGHRVHTAGTGRQAIEVAEDCRPDVIVLDIGLPDMDGYEVAREIRARDWGRDILLVALTGWGQDRDKMKARDAGFDEHVTKPASPDALLRLLAGRTPD